MRSPGSGFRRFDPEAFKGSPGVAVWAPGREVRFEKTWGPPLLLTPLLLAGLFGPFAWLRLSSLHAMPVLPRIAALGLITFSGLAIAAIGWVGLSSGLPRIARFDWASRSLVVKGVRGQRTIAFTEILAIELFTRAYRGRTGIRQYYLSYCCEIRAVLRAGASAPAPLLLTETRSCREDPHDPSDEGIAAGYRAELVSRCGAANDAGPRSTVWSSSVKVQGTIHVTTSRRVARGELRPAGEGFGLESVDFSSCGKSWLGSS